ncbi:MAG: hypothetical protein WKF37_16475, partial [Bryobacteraceae bacterium]
QPAQNFDSVFTLADGPTTINPATILASQPKGPNGHPMLPNGVTAFVVTNPIRFPTVDAWNFTIQRQLGDTMSAEIAYVGTKGTHVFAGTGGDYDPNRRRQWIWDADYESAEAVLPEVRMVAEPSVLWQRREQQLSFLTDAF